MAPWLASKLPTYLSDDDARSPATRARLQGKHGEHPHPTGGLLVYICTVTGGKKKWFLVRLLAAKQPCPLAGSWLGMGCRLRRQPMGGPAKQKRRDKARSLSRTTHHGYSRNNTVAGKESPVPPAIMIDSHCIINTRKKGSRFRNNRPLSDVMTRGGGFLCLLCPSVQTRDEKTHGLARPIVHSLVTPYLLTDCYADDARHGNTPSPRRVSLQNGSD